MSVPERVSSEEFREVALAHRDVCHVYRDFLRLARLRAHDMSSEEFREVTQAHGDLLRLALLLAHDRQRENTASASSVDVPDSFGNEFAQAHKDFLRLALLREQRAKQRENTESASSVDAPDSGSTKDDPGGITEATSSS